MIFLKKKKKNTQTYDDFFKCPEKMSSQKCKRWDMIFLRLSAKVAFAPPPRPPKKWYFFPGGKREREDLPQEIH